MSLSIITRDGKYQIKLTRGDTLQATITMENADGEIYEPEAGDVIRFALKKDFKNEEVLLEKTIPNETLELEILPEETKSLEFGKYVFDIQIEFEDGRIDTFISEGIFIIAPEVE